MSNLIFNMLEMIRQLLMSICFILKNMHLFSYIFGNAQKLKIFGASKTKSFLSQKIRIQDSLFQEIIIKS